MSLSRCLSVGRLLVAAAAMLALASCDHSSTDGSEVDDYLQQNAFNSDPRSTTLATTLTITPDSASVTEVGQQVKFAASGGSPDYAWTVANGNGTISVQGSSECIYTATAAGENTVIVSDQSGQSALATISATSEDLAATVSPTALAADGDMAIANATGGSLSYTWTVIDASLGHILGTDTGSSVVYIRDHNGDNVIQVTDSAGQTYSILINQP